MRTRQVIPNLSRYALIVLVSGMFAWTGCDSNDDQEDGGDNDAELLIGVWSATSIKAGPIDVLAITGLKMTLTLEANGDAGIEAIDENGDVSGVTGTYVVDDQAKTLILDGDDVDDDIVMPYTVIDENTLAVEIDGSDLADLGLDLGDVGDLLASLQIDVELTRDGS
ncbi:MAG: hypothetical protein ACC655_03570 [Rhodothermia bacterium]